MLSEEEIKEMLADASDISRRNSFRFSRKNKVGNISFDEYLKFLNDIQEIIPLSKENKNITLTTLNKL